MISGGHIVIYSRDAEADRCFFRDVLELPDVNVGHGWLIFALPPSEVAVHPTDEKEKHEFYLMCIDIEAFTGEMKEQNIGFDPVQDEGWGLLTHVHLPGGGKLGVYQPRHERPSSP